MSVKDNAIASGGSGDSVLFELLTLAISFYIHLRTPPLQQLHASKVEAVKPSSRSADSRTVATHLAEMGEYAVLS